MLDVKEMEKELPKIMPHYYGGVVRTLFMVAAIIMLVTLPMFDELLSIPTFFSICSILILGLVAGLTNPLVCKNFAQLRSRPARG